MVATRSSHVRLSGSVSLCGQPVRECSPSLGDWLAAVLRTTHTTYMGVQSAKADPYDVTIRALTSSDLPEAHGIFRLAFGTFVGLPDPLAFGGDTDYVRTRFSADPSAAFGAFL